MQKLMTPIILPTTESLVAFHSALGNIFIAYPSIRIPSILEINVLKLSAHSTAILVLNFIIYFIDTLCQLKPYTHISRYL